MKRMIGLVAMIVCLCGCAGNSAKVLGTTEFDGKTITFYYDKTLSNNSGVYYTDENSYQYVLEHHLKSDDESTLLYVDYHSAYIIYEEDEVIDPIETVEASINDEVWNIAIYHLDTSKEYWQIGQNQKELRVSECVSSSTGSSAVCTGELDIQKEELENLMST